MSEEDAKTLVDTVIEKLLEQGVLPENNYGHMTEDQRQECVEAVIAKTQE